MKYSFYKLIVFYCLVSFNAIYSQYADKIIGMWMAGENKTEIEIYKVNDMYFAKIVEFEKSPKSDIKIGTIILRNFIFDEVKNKWINGIVYAPRKKKELKGELRLVDNDRLLVKAEYGFLSKEVEWKRIKK